MENTLYNLTSGLIKMNRIVLFLLIAFPITLRFYSSPFDDYIIFNKLIASIGGICLVGWIFAIGHKSKEILISQGINIEQLKYFIWSILLITISYFFITFLSTEVNAVNNGVHIKYISPIILPITLIISICTTILLSAKALVSVELNREATFGEYFNTSLLMVFALIGLWILQPRIKRIHTIK